jgi:hypothetical protein
MALVPPENIFGFPLQLVQSCEVFYGTDIQLQSSEFLTQISSTLSSEFLTQISSTLSNVQNLQGVPMKSKILNGAILWECFFGEMRHSIPECPLVKDSLTFPNLCAKAFYGYPP